LARRKSCSPPIRLATKVALAEFVPQIGDFVAAQGSLLALYGGATAINDPATAVLALDPVQRRRTRRFAPNPFDEPYAGCC